jgi:hypothetical protein
MHMPEVRIREENNIFLVIIPITKSNAYASSDY